MKLYNLLKDLDYEIISGSVDIDARSVSYDSRKVKGDSVFICIKGANADVTTI